MDPIVSAIADLKRGGITVRRVQEVFGEVYTAVGFAELTRNQVFDLARHHGIPEPSPPLWGRAAYT